MQTRVNEPNYAVGDENDDEDDEWILDDDVLVETSAQNQDDDEEDDDETSGPDDVNANDDDDDELNLTKTSMTKMTGMDEDGNYFSGEKLGPEDGVMLYEDSIVICL